MIYRFIYAAVAIIFITGIVRAEEAIESLAEVNAARARRGLPPYRYDANLTAGALNAANFRAARLMHGHTANDFSALPRGVTAGAAGCAALEPSWGWAACCTYERWTYAGAAKAKGRDGRFYYHIFVR